MQEINLLKLCKADNLDDSIFIQKLLEKNAKISFNNVSEFKKNDLIPLKTELNAI